MSVTVRKKARCKATLTHWNGRFGWASTAQGNDIFVHSDTLDAGGVTYTQIGMTLRLEVQKRADGRLEAVAADLAS